MPLPMTNTDSAMYGPDLIKAYDQLQDILYIHRLRILCVLTIILVPSSALLDVMMYPRLVGIFFISRLVCAFLAGIVYMVVSTSFGSEYCRSLSIVWIVIVLGYNSFMIALSEGAVSPYYVGLNLSILAACLVLPLTFRQCFLACVICHGMFAIASLYNWHFVGMPPSNWGAICFNNHFLMALNSVICITASYYSEKARIRDFTLQYDLDQNKRELEKSYKKLEELDQAKSQFFANISHELRTPLTLIISPLEELRNNAQLKLDQRQSEILDLMYGNSMRLLSLINDLLDLVRLEDGKLNLDTEIVDLKSFLPGLVGSVRGAAERSGLTIASKFGDNDPIYIKADKYRIEKVFLNLLFNAIKFTPSGGAITVSARHENGSVAVDVEDTGIGIAEVNIDSVFDRFWQEDGSSTRTRQGTGIGLALVRELVELHGGTVGIVSEKDKGTIFRVNLPVSEEPSTAAATHREPTTGWLEDLHKKARYYPGGLEPARSHAEDETENDGFRYTLLIVEDEPDMMRFLVSELRKNYDLLQAVDGEEGVKMALEHRPHLIITDMMLPKIDGIDLCRQLKASPILVSVKIVLVTARADDQTKLTGLNAGADDFLVKPFSTLELKTRLANLLLNSQLERELHNQNQVLENTLRKLRSTEAQLIQSERLSALGNLSAGIMHEINNPVNFMMTAVQLLKQGVANDVDNTEMVEDIEGGLKRIRDIIIDLKGFAYGGNAESREEIEPESIFHTAKRLLSHEIGEDVVLTAEVYPNTPVYGNRNQLTQLLVNLIQNANHATIDNPMAGKQRTIQVRMRPEDNQYLISVRDNGIGISKEDRVNIFDPFFTTKEVGTGTGIGLSISHTIVKKHGGEISVDSVPGSFTQFSIRIPLSQPVLN